MTGPDLDLDLDLVAQAEANVAARRALFAELRDRRKMLGLTVEDVSERCSWPTARVIAFEAGADTVTVRDLSAYAHAVNAVIRLGISTD